MYVWIPPSEMEISRPEIEKPAIPKNQDPRELVPKALLLATVLLLTAMSALLSDMIADYGCKYYRSLYPIVRISTTTGPYSPLPTKSAIRGVHEELSYGTASINGLLD